MACLGLLPSPEAPAQQAITPTAISAAAVWFGPLPAPTLFSPEVMARVEQLAADANWPDPDAIKVWPRDEFGNPIVETRQLDELWHDLGRRRSKYRLREMYRGSMKHLEALNPGMDLGELEQGQRILAWQRDPEKISQSIGYANRGRLSNAEPMPPGDNYVILHAHRSFGTYYAVSEIVRAMDAFAVRFPDAYPLMIGDLSFRTGRRIHPHKSHQSGRDVDITFPRVNEPRDYRRFHNIRSRDLDVPASLWLLKSFIDGGQIEYIFVDSHFQRKLMKEAREQGAPEAWIKKVFQAGGGRGAIIRHARGHRDHFHIRFKCQESDKRCR